MSNKKDCYIFKDLYPSYLEGEVEEETSEWINLHLAECEQCKSWIESFCKEDDSADKDKELCNSAAEHETDSEKEVVKRAKILLITSLIIVIILAVWMSLWIFA